MLIFDELFVGDKLRLHKSVGQQHVSLNAFDLHEDDDLPFLAL